MNTVEITLRIPADLHGSLATLAARGKWDSVEQLSEHFLASVVSDISENHTTHDNNE